MIIKDEQYFENKHLCSGQPGEDDNLFGGGKGPLRRYNAYLDEKIVRVPFADEYIDFLNSNPEVVNKHLIGTAALTPVEVGGTSYNFGGSADAALYREFMASRPDLFNTLIPAPPEPERLPPPPPRPNPFPEPEPRPEPEPNPLPAPFPAPIPVLPPPPPPPPPTPVPPPPTPVPPTPVPPTPVPPQQGTGPVEVPTSFPFPVGETVRATNPSEMYESPEVGSSVDPAAVAANPFLSQAPGGDKIIDALLNPPGSTTGSVFLDLLRSEPVQNMQNPFYRPPDQAKGLM